MAVIDRKVLDKLGIQELNGKYTQNEIDIEKTNEYIDAPVVFFVDGSMATDNPLNPEVFQIKSKENVRQIYYANSRVIEEFKEYVVEKLSKEVNIEEEIQETVEEIDNTEIRRLINAIVLHAVKQGASDIHIHPKEKNVQIKMRVDGVLRLYETYSKTVGEYLINKIKTMAKMDVTQKLVPQDAKMVLEIGEESYELRVSTCPTIYGEDCVLRIQQTENLFNLKLEDLGFEKEDLEIYRKNFLKPTGMILNVGATGQGKTTTFYLTIKEITEKFQGKKNIITVEDPVEIKFEKIVQIEVDDRQGRTFPVVLRSLLRQDPDVILIGEIRDEETAEIGVRASITGHLVLATLHANDSFNAITRLRDLGLSDQLISSTLNCILSQRLVRTLCDCKEKVKTPVEAKELGVKSEYIYRPKGCEKCDYTGYRGRTAVIEVLQFDEEIKTAIAEGINEVGLKKMARAKGFRNLWENAIRKVEEGITSLEEIQSVVQRDTILNMVERNTQIEIGKVYYPNEKIPVYIEELKQNAYLFDRAGRGVSIIFDKTILMEIDRPYKVQIDGEECAFIPKSFKEYGEKFVIGGIIR